MVSFAERGKILSNDPRRKAYVAPKKSGGLTDAQAARRSADALRRQRAAADVRAKEAARKASVQQVQAEVGDTFGSVAERLGVPEDAFVKANVLDTTIKAGAVYNVPAQPLSAITGPDQPPTQPPQDWWLNVPPGTLPVTGPRSEPPPRPMLGDRNDAPWWILPDTGPMSPPKPPVFPTGPTGNASIPPGVGQGAGVGEDIVDWIKDKLGFEEDETFQDWALRQPGGDLGGGIPNMLKSAEEAVKDFLFPPTEESSIGGGKVLGAPQYQDPRANRPFDREAYSTIPQQVTPVSPFGFTAQPFTMSPSPPGVTARPEDIAASVIPDTQQVATTPSGPWQMPTHPSENPEVYFAINQTGGDAGAQYEVDVQAWDDEIMAHYEQGLGRGGGIAGWIEERTGIVGIDPWNMTDEEFEIFLAAFDTGELNYLESQGFLVPQDVYVGGGVPAYGTGGVSRAGGGSGSASRYPVGYGGYNSQQPSYAPRQSYLGLTSWSI